MAGFWNLDEKQKKFAVKAALFIQQTAIGPAESLVCRPLKQPKMRTNLSISYLHIL